LLLKRYVGYQETISSVYHVPFRCCIKNDSFALVIHLLIQRYASRASDSRQGPATMTMRLTPGKIYAGVIGFTSFMFIWNRYSSRGVMGRVEGMKQERMRQAELLRAADSAKGNTGPS
jgi:hypothetical protein